VQNDPPQAAAKPFAKNRDGFVMAEGAGAVVLESYEAAVGGAAHSRRRRRLPESWRRVAFQHHGAGAFRITKPSRFLANGFAAAWGGSFCTERAESSENRIRSFRIDRAVGGDAQRRVGLAAPDRSRPMLDRRRLAPDAQAVDSEIGEPAVRLRRQCPRRPSRTRSLVIGRKRPVAAGAQEVVIAHRFVGARAPGQRPRAAAIRSRPAPPARNSGPGNGRGSQRRDSAIASSTASSASAPTGRRRIGVERNKIDRAGDLGLEAVGAEPRDRPDAGFRRP